MSVRGISVYGRLALETAASALLGRQAAQRHLSQRLSELPGVPAKIGQVLAMRSGIAFESGARSRIEPEELASILRRKVPRLFQDLTDLNQEPRVASLAQVHEGRLKDGRRVAVKVQFPGVRDELEAQVAFAFSAFEKLGLGRGLDWDTQGFRKHLLASFREELDYLSEARSQTEFRRAFSHNPRVLVPEVYPEYSSEAVLTQEFVDSDSLRSLKELPGSDRNEIGQVMLRAYLEGMFRHGLVHGDLHPGNWGYVSRSRSLVLYDFGSVLRLKPEQIRAFKDLIGLSSRHSSVEHGVVYERLGFDPAKMSAISDVLGDLTRALCEPFHATGDWEFRRWKLSQRLTAALQDRKWKFRSAGAPWFFGFMRSAQGLVHALSELEAAVRPGEIYREVCGDGTTATIDPGEESWRGGAAESSAESAPLSRHLKVEISERGEQVAFLEFPARAAANLESLIPEEARSQLEERGIHLARIVESVIRSGYAPQVLFSAQTPRKAYRVWLE